MAGFASGGFVIYTANGHFDDAQCYVIDLFEELWLQKPTRMEMESLAHVAEHLLAHQYIKKNRKIKIFGNSSHVLYAANSTPNRLF